MNGLDVRKRVLGEDAVEITLVIEQQQLRRLGHVLCMPPVRILFSVPPVVWRKREEDQLRAGTAESR